MAITTTLQSCDALACLWVIGGTNARISYWEVASAWVTRCFICSVVHLDLVEIYAGHGAQRNIARALQSRCAVYSARFNVSQMEGQDLCKHTRVAVFFFSFFLKS